MHVSPQSRSWYGPSLISARYANITIGSPCIIDNTTYTDFNLHGQQYQQVFTRDNCHTPQLYCKYDSMTCQHTKAIGIFCLGDQECETVRRSLFFPLSSTLIASCRVA